VKIAMMTYTMARGMEPGEEFDVEALCRFTRELGLDAIDWVGTHGHDPAEIRKVTDDYGLKNVCYTFFPDINYPTSAQRARGREAFKREIETAVTLGADKVMLPVPGKEGQRREVSFRNVIAGLREVIGFAQQLGVTVTVENFPDPTSPFVTSVEVNRAVEELPELRITFDNGNVTTGGENAGDSFRRSAPYVVHAHFKDYAPCLKDEPGAMLGLDGKYRRAVLVGDGEVDQIGSLKAMKEYGYQGYINFEYEGREYSPREATVEGVRRIREWMAALDE